MCVWRICAHGSTSIKVKVTYHTYIIGWCTAPWYCICDSCRRVWIHVHTPCIYMHIFTCMHTPHTHSLWRVWPFTIIHVHTPCIYVHIFTSMHTPHTRSLWRVWPPSTCSRARIRCIGAFWKYIQLDWHVSPRLRYISTLLICIRALCKCIGALWDILRLFGNT